MSSFQILGSRFLKRVVLDLGLIFFLQPTSITFLFDLTLIGLKLIEYKKK